MTDERFKDIVARIALAIQRAGGDSLGDIESLHKDFIELISDHAETKKLMWILRDGLVPIANDLGASFGNVGPSEVKQYQSLMVNIVEKIHHMQYEIGELERMVIAARKPG